jgi:hypothetical protein
VKKIIAIIVISFLFQFTSFSQICLPTGIIFASQAQIDNFQNDFPGCFVILGNVEINGSDINNLNGLEVLINLEGDLMIGEWSCSTYTNPILSTLTGLDNITSIDGHLLIYFNSVLADLNGLNSVNSIGGALYIENNPALNSLSSLESLNTIGSNFTRGFSIKNNNVLTNLNGLEQLTSLQGFMRINSNDALSSINGLENLASISGDLRIENNIALTSLAGLDSITGESITYLEIKNNILLTECDVQSICDYLVSPNGSYDISDNASGCNNPQEVADACGIIIISVEEIENEFSIYPNPATNELFISSENNILVNEITIYNQLGQNVLQQNGVNNSIDISMLQQGIYVIELVSGNSAFREKLMIH